MEKVLAIVEQLQVTSGRNDKEAIIRENKDNELLKDIFKFVYSTEIKTGIKRKKLEKKVKSKPTVKITDFYSLRDFLVENGTGSDRTIANIQQFLSEQTDGLKELYIQIILQDLRGGLSEKTINSALGYEFIYIHKLEKGEVAEPRHLKLLKGKEFGIYKKVDGYRAEIEVGNGKVKIMSSGGELFKELVDIETVLLSSNLPHGVFACELLAIDSEGTMTRMEVFNKTGSLLRRDGIKQGIEVNVFNFIPDNGFYEGKHSTTCRERKALAKELVDKINSPLIKNVDPFYIGKDLSQIDYWFEQMILAEDEGIMVLPMDQKYNGKKSYQQMLKIKTENEADLRIVGFEKGEKGKAFENTLGKMLVNYKGNTINVMAGYKIKYDSAKYDDRLVRDYIWNHQEELLGKIVKVRYMDETTNDSGGIDLRMCRLIEYRDDKTEESYN